MKGFWTIVKKELLRFFKDKRLMAALILPGILIYVVYSVLGSGLIGSLGGVEKDYEYTVYALNAPADLEETLALPSTFRLVEIEEEEVEDVKRRIEEQKADLFLAFSEGFAFSGGEGVCVSAYYNSASAESSTAWTVVGGLISEKQYDSPKFTVSPSDLVTEDDMTAMIFSSIGPMLVLTLLFAGCLSIAPESIAGEKERGTLATMLVTPVKRGNIAFGKVFALSVLSLISGVCSFFGLILSLPKLMGDIGGGLGSYEFGELAMLFGITLSSVLLVVSIVSIVSAFAKSVKEATSLSGPLTLLVVVLGVATMFVGDGSWYWYLVPIFNSALAMKGVFSFAASPVGVLITVVSNFVYAVLLAFALAKMFDSEKIVNG